MDDDHGVVEYGLVMPFTVVTSKGGPYDDRAFVAGYQMGLLSGELHLRAEPIERTFYAGLLRQADLIAMREGWEMKPVEMPDDTPSEWTCQLFVPLQHIDGTGAEK